MGLYHDQRSILGYTLLDELPDRLRQGLRYEEGLRGLDYDLLIVDDEASLRTALFRALDRKGYQVITS